MRRSVYGVLLAAAVGVAGKAQAEEPLTTEGTAEAGSTGEAAVLDATTTEPAPEADLPPMPMEPAPAVSTPAVVVAPAAPVVKAPEPAVAAAPVVAEEAPRKNDKVKTWGSYRIAGTSESPIALGIQGATAGIEHLGQTLFLEHRLRVGSAWDLGDFAFDLELDVLSGLLNTPESGQVLAPYPSPDGGAARPEMADPTRNRAWGASLNSLAFRKAMLTWKSLYGHVGFGATSFGWGQGMLANGGDAEIDATLGDQRFGNRVMRLMYATKPLFYLSGGEIEEDITSVVAFDLGLYDSTSQLVNPAGEWMGDRGFFKDRALAFVVALKHKRGNYSSGIFATRRSVSFEQTASIDPNVTVGFNPGLSVWAVDATIDYTLDLSKKTKAYVALEGAFVTGDTNYVRNNTCMGNTDDNHCAISQQGAVGKLGITSGALSIELQGGYASGDANPTDGTVRNFTFNRDYKVGLILFDQVLAWQSAGTVRRATDANVTNVPAAGVDLLSTSGAISNAVFAHPVLKLKTAEKTTLTMGVVLARAAQGYLDAFWVNRKSAPLNPFGQAAGSDYGLEFDVGQDTTVDLGAGVSAQVGLAGGYFIPGDAFLVDPSGRTMDPVWLVKARSAIVF